MAMWGSKADISDGREFIGDDGRGEGRGRRSSGSSCEDSDILRGRTIVADD